MRIFFTLALLAVAFIGFGQISLPDFSPEGKIIQTIGYTHFIIRYERPTTRGRKIMGDLVPYDKMWRTGAGKCTTIQFDQPVKIEDQNIPAGIYALVTIPSKKEWIILLNSDTSKIYGEDRDYDKRNEVARLSVKSTTTSRTYNAFTIDLDVAGNSGILYLSWENTQVAIPIETNSSALAENKIQKALSETPNDPQLLSSISFYYEMNNKKIPEACAYIKKAMTLREDRWYYRLAVDLLVKMKNYKEAIAMAQRGISFSERTHPVEWKISVQEFEKDLAKIAAMK